jgi:hypothetical protein
MSRSKGPIGRAFEPVDRLVIDGDVVRQPRGRNQHFRAGSVLGDASDRAAVAGRCREVFRSSMEIIFACVVSARIASLPRLIVTASVPGGVNARISLKPAPAK